MLAFTISYNIELFMRTFWVKLPIKEDPWIEVVTFTTSVVKETYRFYDWDCMEKNEFWYI